MEEKLTLLCVHNGDAIMKAWPTIQDGLEIMLEHAGSDVSLDKIFNDLMSGRLLLWVGMVGGVYSGFVTTQVVEMPPNKRHLWIVHAYKTVKTPTVWLLEAYQEIEKFAISRKCDSIRFYGLRKKWQDKFFTLGFHEGYQEFVKDL